MNRMFSFKERWTGPICITIGLVLLGMQVVAWVYSRFLSWVLIGPGVGLLLVGVSAWFYRVDDKQPSALLDELDRSLNPKVIDFQRLCCASNRYLLHWVSLCIDLDAS